MSFTETAAFGALDLIATLYPKTASFVAAVKKWGPRVAPVIINALHEGGSALKAAEEAAPELTKSVQDLVNSLRAAQGRIPVPGQTKRAQHENLFRVMVGFRHMTPEQEKMWMDGATPHNDPSQENSKFGG